MIKRPTNTTEWKSDRNRADDRDRMSQELTAVINHSMASLADKLEALVKRDKQTDHNA